MNEVYRAIPHRPPFLFVDEIVSCDAERAVTRRLIKKEEFYFEGHYPGNPIMPGVLLCESVFQTGAILLTKGKGEEIGSGVTPVLVRIKDARFRKMIRPGDDLSITATLDQKMGDFYFLKGSIESDGKKVLTVDFSLGLLPPEKAADKQ